MGRAKRAKQTRHQDMQQKAALSEPVIDRGRAFYLICLALFMITLAVYWQAAHFPLTGVDDPDYISGNPIVQKGLSSEGFIWSFGIGRAGNWHPLTWMSHMLDVQIFGLAPGLLRGTGGHHLSSILLHIAGMLLLFLVLHKATGSLWSSAFVAALFGLHPLHVESVAWVAERKDVLSTCFMMLALWAYIRYVKQPGFFWYAAVTVAFGLGLMSKQMLVSLPLLLLLLDFWPLQRISSAGDLGKRAAEKIPLLLMSAAAAVVVIMAQKASGAISGGIPLGTRLSNAVVTCVVYLLKMIWPSGLAHYYSFQGSAWTLFQIGGSLSVLLLLTVLSLRLARTWPMVAVGWFWYVISLLPVLGLVQVGGQARADRYTYIPLIGIFMAVSYSVPALLKRKGRADTTVPLMVVAGIVLIAMLPITYRQIGYWRDTEVLYRRALAVTEKNWFVHSALAGILHKQAEAIPLETRLEEAKKKAAESVAHARLAVKLNPSMADAHTILGNGLRLLSNAEERAGEKAELLDEAEREYEKALAIRPADAMAQNNIANVYLERNKIELAIEHYREALKLDSTLEAVHYNLAVALERNRQPDEALVHYEEALQMNPGNTIAYWANTRSAELLAVKGRRNEAVDRLRQAVLINERAYIDPRSRVANQRLQELTNTPTR